MFSTPTFFLILVTLPTITEQVPSRTKKVDWEKCKTEFRCYCSGGAVDETLMLLNAPPASEDACKIVAQSRYFTAESAMFQLQINGDKQGTELMLTVNGLSLFGCKVGQSGKIELVGEQQTLKKHRMTLFEDRSRFEEGGFSLCALKAERMKDLYTYVKEDDKFDGDLKLMLTTSSGPSEEYLFFYSGPKELFIRQSSSIPLKCDPYSFEDKLSYVDFHVLPVMNRDDDHLDCTSYEDGSYTMRYDIGDEIKDLAGLTCVQDATTRAWHYEFEGHVDTEGNPLRLAAGEKYTIYCAAPIGKVCKNPFLTTCPQGPECPSFDPGPAGESARLKCTDMKWRINDDFMKLTKDPECKADPMNGQNAAAFFITTESGMERRVDGARCFTDYDCNKTATIFLDDAMEYSNGEVKCTDKSIVMEIHFYEKNETLPATSFACDKADGQWKNKTSSGSLTEVIPAGSQLRCPAPNTEAAAQTGEVTLSESAVIGIIIGSSIGFLILVALILFGVLYYKKTRRVKTIDKDALRKMDQAERIKHYREFFPMVLKTTPTTIHHIVDGLIELDVLLEMEIEDPDVWETVYPFLMRIHGTIFRMDRGIGLMFNRYLYLKAKAIIDKNGWTCKTPIRKNNTDGLIRCVAITLLSFVLVDGVCKDSKKLVANGFRALGFAGRAQYPHCGLLWSLVSHASIKAADPYVTGECIMGPQDPRLFDVELFQARMKQIATHKKDIPPDEIIPNFGSVADQAIFAHGAWQNIHNHVSSFGRYVMSLAGTENGTRIATTYMAGMALSVGRSPAHTILLSTQQFPDPSKDAFGHLHKAATPEQWAKQVEKAFPICISYGRHMDANRLEERFITNSPVSSPKLTQMRLEQSEFVAAMDKQLEEMREWYAEHTDKDEYKKKPVYVISDKIKHRCGPSVNPNLKPGDGPKSAGETKSNSGGAPTGKSQTDVKSSEGSSDSKNTPTPEKPAPETPAPAPSGPPSAPPSA